MAETYYRLGEIITSGSVLPETGTPGSSLFFLTVDPVGLYIFGTDNGWHLWDNLVPGGVVSVSHVDQLPAPVAGVITLEDDLTYQITGTVDLGANRIVAGLRNSFVGRDRQLDQLVSTTTGPLITVPTGQVSFTLDIVGLSCPNGSLFAVTGTDLALLNCRLSTSAQGGTITDCGLLILRNSIVQAGFTTGGVVFSGTHGIVQVRDNVFANNAGTLFDLGSSTIRTMSWSRNNQIVAAGQTWLSGGSATITEGASLDNNFFSGAGTYVTGVTHETPGWMFSDNFGIANTPHIADGLEETGAHTTLTMAAVADGQFLKRVGTTIAGASGSGGAAWGSISGTLADQTDLQAALAATVAANAGITGATKTKITYDAKGLVTVGADATTADVADSANKRYVTDAQLTVIGNTSGTNTGDQTAVSGNAGTATALQTPRTINGTSFNGTANITLGTGSVTLAQQADMASASVLYRKTAGTGAPEVQTLATLKTDLGLTGTNSGDQTITLTSDITGSGTGSFATTYAGIVPFALGGRTGAAATSATTGTMTVSMTTAVITITPTGACTFNASGGVTGQIATFCITTSGVSSFTLTFGTNFRKVGTLATGTTSARFFSVSFVCVNGTTWQEIGRTAAQT